MGGGMILVDCDVCDGVGKTVIVEPPNYLEKGSPSYTKAKKAIKKISGKISDSEAEKILDEEIEKQAGENK
jgi:hypothetical protein